MAVARNIIANTVGVGVLIAATAATTILGFRLAGAEQYGLIGFYFTLHGIVAIMDTGLGPGVIREVAQSRSDPLSADARSKNEPATILFTFQGIYAAITAATTILLIAASPLIASHWLSARTISVSEIEIALVLTALTIGLQRLRTIYSVFLEGLEKQVLANLLQSGGACLRTVVVLGAMMLIAPTAIAFLGGMLLVSAVETIATALCAWRALERSGGAKARFSIGMIRRLWRYLLTNSLAVALGAVIQGADKIVVSAALPLDIVGRYMFISQICLIAVKLVSPNVTAVFPRLSSHVRRGDVQETRRIYFAASQMTSCIVAVFIFGVAFFGSEALFVLSGNLEFAREYWMFFALLAAASGVISLSLTPNALQLVEGYPGTALRNNLVGTLLYVPAVIVLTPLYGIMAPASLWLAVGALSFAVFAWRAHQHVLAGHTWPWLRLCVLPQFLVTATIFTLAKTALLQEPSIMIVVSVAILSAGAAFAASILVSGELRNAVRGFLRRAVAAQNRARTAP